MKAVIPAGGKGTRLGSIGRDLPKALLEIGGFPLIEHQLRLVRRHGIDEAVLCVGYMADRIQTVIGDGRRLGVKVTYSEETDPLGTAGALRNAIHLLGGEFLVLYSDVMVDMDLGRLVRFHRKAGGICTLVVHPNDHPFDSDLVEIDGKGRVSEFHSRPHRLDTDIRNLVNAAVYVMSSEVLARLEPGRYLDFGSDVFPHLVDKQAVYGYVTSEYIRDIGTKRRIEEVRADYASGAVSGLNRKKGRKAVFLDRDGVINRDVGHLHDVADFQLLPGVSEAIRKINRSGYMAVVVTNQPVVARNLCPIDTIHEVHRRMETLLGREGAWLDAIYFCPHHPDKGYPGERPEYKVECDCRKPADGMLRLAAREHRIDLSSSFMVGDSWRDIQAGRNAGTRMIAVGMESGDGYGSFCPDARFDDLKSAVDFIVDSPSA